MNKELNEIEVSIAGKKYTMRPTFAAFCEIEAELDQRIIPLASRWTTLNVGIAEITTVLRIGIKHGSGEELTNEELGPLLMKNAQLGKFLPLTLAFLNAPFKHSDEEDKDGGKTKRQTRKPKAS